MRLWESELAQYVPKRDMSSFSCRRRRGRMPFAPEIQRYLRHGRWASKKVRARWLSLEWLGASFISFLVVASSLSSPKPFAFFGAAAGSTCSKSRETEEVKKTETPLCTTRRFLSKSSIHRISVAPVCKKILGSGLAFNRQATGAIELGGVGKSAPISYSTT